MSATPAVAAVLATYEREMAEQEALCKEGWVVLPLQHSARVRADPRAFERAVRRVGRSRLFIRESILTLLDARLEDREVWTAVENDAYAADLLRVLPIVGKVPHEEFIKAVEDPQYGEQLVAGMRAAAVLVESPAEAAKLYDPYFDKHPIIEPPKLQLAGGVFGI